MVPSFVAAAALRTTTCNSYVMFHVHFVPGIPKFQDFNFDMLKKMNTTSCSVPTLFGFQVDAAQDCRRHGASGEESERIWSHQRPRR